MSVEHMPDERLTHFYESIRQQVEIDRRNKYQFMGPSVREYADRLRSEMIRRRLGHTPIDWPISPAGSKPSHKGQRIMTHDSSKEAFEVAGTLLPQVVNLPFLVTGLGELWIGAKLK